MAKEDPIHFDGTVTTALPDSDFRVEVTGDHDVLCPLAGQPVGNGASVLEGDEARLEVTSLRPGSRPNRRAILLTRGDRREHRSFGPFRLVTVDDIQHETSPTPTSTGRWTYWPPRTGLGAPDPAPRIGAVTDLVELARDAEVPVWYTRDPHREDDPEWGIRGRRAEEGARGWEFVDELEPR